MKILVFTSGDGPESRQAIEFADTLTEDGYEVEKLDADAEATHQRQEIYDIYSFPSFVVVQDDGSFVERWRGRIPLASDIKMFLS